MVLVSMPLDRRDEERKAEVLDILRRFLEMAERGEIAEVMVAALSEDELLHFGASGQVNKLQQLGLLESFKATIIEGE